ncbi:MAG: hypothetical protein WBP58_03540 [Chitinophagaceae bacterium]
MTHSEMAKSKKLSNGFNRFMYGAFVILALGRIVFQGMDGLSEAVPSLGIALIFDPFDHSVAWNDRPRYQRVWLIAHLVIGTVLLGLWGFHKLY